MTAILRICALCVALSALGAYAHAGDTDPVEPNIWWNHPKLIRALALDEAQRAAMDAHLQAAIPALRTQQREATQTRKAWQEALVEGRWEAAREVMAAAGQQSAHALQAQGRLKLAVLQELQPQQRRDLQQRFPGLLARAWLRFGGGQRGR